MREEIVKESTTLFLKYGFKSVTMDEIAQHMRISKKTIYNHFPNKEQLVEESAIAHFEFIIDRIKTISNQAKDPIIELYQLKKEATQHLSNEKNSPQYQLQKFYPKIYVGLKKREFRELGKFFSNSIRKGINTGLFRPDLDVDFVTRIFFNGIRGISDIELFPIENYKIDHLMIVFSEYHLRAISTSVGIEKLEKYKQELNL
ncbi:MAG: TetR/AcrR family transcriptional regulator [Flavobacteriaceae bacterium]|jgi:AcrR family transcriptional regulator